MNNEKKNKRQESIADIFTKSELGPLGFKYVKSLSGFQLKDGDLVFTIGFASSRVNILHDTNILIINAGVENLKFAEWRKQHLGRYPSGLVGGGKIKNLFTPGPPYFDFDIKEDELTRSNVVSEVQNIIKTDVLRFFKICEKEDDILDNINLPCFSVGSAIQYFHFLGREELVTDVINKKQLIHQELKSDIEHYSDLIMKSGKPTTGFAETFSNAPKRVALEIAEALVEIKKTS